jgi:Leucine-rich repeat (LRR) protein
MANLAAPSLLQAFFDHVSDELLGILDEPSKAALRLCCKNAKAFVDGTVTTAQGEADALEAILRCDWRLSELYIDGNTHLNDALARNDLNPLLNAVCSKFPTLQVLEIISPPSLYNLPVKIGHLSKLRALKIENANFRALPASFGQFSSLEKLEIHEQDQVTSSPLKMQGLAPLKQLTQLKYLKLHVSAVSAHAFPDWLRSWNFPVLEDLTLGDHLQSLPSSISNFSNLTALNIEESLIYEVPESIGSLQRLKRLHLWGFSLSLSTSISKLTALEALDVVTGMQSFALVEHCHKLTELKLGHSAEEVLIPYPEFLWTFTWLKKLNLAGCAESSLPDGLGNLQELESLHLFGHLNVQELPETIGNLTSLISLNISDCSIFSKLPESIGNLKLLKVLEIRDCDEVTILPDSIGQLQSLESIVLADVVNLDSLPSSIGNLRALKQLVVHSCEEVFLPASFADLVLDMPAEECSLEEVSFVGSTKLVIPVSSRLILALNRLQERGILRCTQ